MKLSELEARGELFGRKVTRRSWENPLYNSVVFEYKLSNGIYVGLDYGGCHYACYLHQDHDDWELVAEPKERYWLWIYGDKSWIQHNAWMTKDEARELFKNNYRISPICPVEGVELD